MNIMQAWVIGNWKQQPATLQDVDELLDSVIKRLPNEEVPLGNTMVIPCHVHLQTVNSKLMNTSIALGAQDICAFSAETGAFTGDCSAAQVRDAGADWVLVGHSERRQYYGEDNDILQKKIRNALSQQLGVIFCIGETKAQYDSEQTLQVLEDQLSVIQRIVSEYASESNNKANLAKRFIVAYEPVWAIGTGKVPTVEEVAATHSHIKQVITRYSGAVGELDNLCVLYGGSVNADNAAMFAQADSVDGALVGGASLNAESFLAIMEAFSAAKASNIQ